MNKVYCCCADIAGSLDRPVVSSSPRAETSSDTAKAKRFEKLWSLMSSYLSSGRYFEIKILLFVTLCPFLACYLLWALVDVNTIQRSVVNHVEYTLASTRFDMDDRKAYLAAAHR